MKGVIFKETKEIQDLKTWIPGKVYIWGELQAFLILQDLSNNGFILEDHVIIKDLSRLLNRGQDFISMKDKKILIIRGGGIGDILALSPLVSYLWERHDPKEIIILTDTQYKDVVSWFPDPVTIKSYLEPIFNYNRILKNKDFVYISSEGLIDKSPQNWIQLYFSTIGQEFLSDVYFRPDLITSRISEKKSNIDPKKKSITLVLRGSSVLRSIPFFEIWTALRSVLKDRINEFNIYTHINNTTFEDRDYMLKLYKLGYTNLNLVKCETIQDYLLDLFDSGLVFSVDTSAIHFREGIRKNAIAIFNSIGSQARSKYYQFTKSYDIISPCKLQPCYPNSVEATEICKTGIENNIKNYSPCLCKEFNPDLQDQLTRILRDNLDLF